MHICVHKLLQGTPQTIAMPSTATAGGGGSKKKKRKEKKQARLFSKVVLPPCPECPKAPTSPHPDWIVRKLPKPECVKTPSGDLVWKFYCFYHHKTYKTKWFPPPPPVENNYDSDEDDSGIDDDNNDEDDDDDADVINLAMGELDLAEDEEEDQHPRKKMKGIEGYVVSRPSLESYEKELLGEDEETDEECVEEEDEEPVELTPAQRTFTDEKPETLYMAPTPSQVGADGRLLSLPIRCEELGIDIRDPITNKKYTRPQLKSALRTHMIEVFKIVIFMLDR